MKNDQTPSVSSEQVVTYEPPTLTVVGEASEVVQGTPLNGWDRQGLSEPEFEFQPDDE